jgi:hypothetical protein
MNYGDLNREDIDDLWDEFGNKTAGRNGAPLTTRMGEVLTAFQAQIGCCHDRASGITVAERARLS